LIGLLTARIDRLTDSPKRVLSIASVAGRTFSRRLMLELAGDAASLDTALYELERSGLIEPVEARWGVTYTFRHAAYTMLLQRRRAQLHGEIGAALERLHRDEIDEYAALLAYHYDRSQDDRKAISYTLRAGRAQLRVYANREAAAFFARVVERLRAFGQEDSLLADTLQWLGDARSAAGEINAAIGHWQESLVMHQRRGDRNGVAVLHRKLGNAWFARGERQRAIDNYQRGIEMLKGTPPGAALASLYDELGRVYFRIGQDQQAIEWASRALALAEALDDAEAASLALNTLGIAHARGGEIERGIAEVERSLKLALDSVLPMFG
jgi:predicted ATPase